MKRVLVSSLLIGTVLISVTGLQAPSGGAANRPMQKGSLLGAHLSLSAQAVAAILSGRPFGRPRSGHSGHPCRAERSKTGNSQVTCLAEDGASPQNTQSETTVVARGRKVVVGFNDSLVCCSPAINLSGYSVSLDGGKTFKDMGDLPWKQTVQPIGDPSLAVDQEGNVFYATLALSVHGNVADSLIALYEMPKESTRFQLLSVPVNVGDSSNFFADKELLSIGRDGKGHQHFYITWTSYAHSFIQGPVVLTDSTDGVHWRNTQISASDTCAPTTPGSHPIPAGGTVYITWEQFNPDACSTNPDDTRGTHMVAAFDVSSGTVTRTAVIAQQQGAGDILRFCGFADLEVIETAPGHDSRLFDASSSTIDRRGTLYAAWNDRPQGPGGGFDNATRIYLSYSRDGGVTWSVPQVISGPRANDFMNDRYQPWIVADGAGLHAMWYERVKNPHGTRDLLRTDREDLSLATPKSGPRVTSPETALGTAPFPIYQTNPNQDPVIAACYMGDYNQIFSSDDRQFVSWGDNRNVVTTSGGRTEHQADVFLDSYRTHGRST